jgi:hypothetical protein
MANGVMYFVDESTSSPAVSFAFDTCDSSPFTPDLDFTSAYRLSSIHYNHVEHKLRSWSSNNAFEYDTEPQTYSSRTFTVRGSFFADFDDGAESSGSSADIWWTLSTATVRWWNPNNGATFKYMGTNEPTYADCKNATLSSANLDAGVPDGDITDGAWVCGLTNEGRFTKVEVVSISAGHVMTLSHHTWATRDDGYEPAQYGSGSFDVRGTWSGDLDEGQEDQSSARDFRWRSTGDELQALNGATFAVMGDDPVGWHQCGNATFAGGFIHEDDMPVGTWLCSQTNAGRMSAFEVTDIDVSDNYHLYLDYTTW